MRDDRVPRTPVAEGTSSPPMTRQRHLAERLSGFRIASEGIVFAGNPIGNAEFVNAEVRKIVTKHAKRLAAIREFANTSRIDVSASPFKGFYKHLALALIQYTCDRRLDHALHVTPTAWIDSEHLVNAQRAVRHLNTIGVYLNAKREGYGRLGCARKGNKEKRLLDVCAPACGVYGDGFTHFSRNADGSALLAIQQSEENRRARAVIDVMLTDGTLTNLDDDLLV